MLPMAPRLLARHRCTIHIGPDIERGGTETASGERYNPTAWAAAIQADLRERFGGVYRGQRSSYALVEGINKKAIIKINDVGPLKLGRIIDFDQRTMRYFDPTLQLGLIHNVKVTPLQGDDWTPGPIAEAPLARAKQPEAFAFRGE